MVIAIVTGASSGLGREFVRQIAAKEAPDEIWAIARREERLHDLAQELPVPLRAVPLDLSWRESLNVLEALLAAEQPEVSLLINNAGFGFIGRYDEIRSDDAMSVVDVNCRAVVGVTNAVLPYMGDGGRIFHISSTSAFQPFQFLNVYAASKAFILSYSRGLRWELKGTGIRVIAICPYWIKDTEFIPKAQAGGNPQRIRRFPFASTAERAAALSLRYSTGRWPVITPGLVSTLHRLLSKCVPRSLLQAIWALQRRI